LFSAANNNRENICYEYGEISRFLNNFLQVAVSLEFIMILIILFWNLKILIL